MKNIFQIILFIFLTSNTAFAQADHIGGGSSTEADLKNYMNEIDQFLLTTGGKTAFPEIEEYNKINGPFAFKILISQINPVVKDGVVLDQFGIERTCISRFGEKTTRTITCNSKKLPDQSIQNQRSLYRIIFHELLVHAELEKPISKDVPSEYSISAKITNYLTLIGGVRWFLMVPEFLDGMPNPLSLDFSRMIGINSPETIQKMKISTDQFLQIFHYELISMAQNLTPVVGDPNHQYYFQFVVESQSEHANETVMTMPCFAIINENFEESSMKAQCAWTGEITANAQKLVNRVSIFNQRISKKLKGDTIIIGNQYGNYIRLPDKKWNPGQLSFLGVSEKLNHRPEIDSMIDACLLRQAQELEKLNHNGYERLIKAISISDLIINETKLNPVQSRIINAGFSMSKSWTWNQGTTDEKNITIENGFFADLEIRINLYEKDPCSIISLEEFKKAQSDKGLPIIGPESRVY